MKNWSRALFGLAFLTSFKFSERGRRQTVGAADPEPRAASLASILSIKGGANSLYSLQVRRTVSMDFRVFASTTPKVVQKRSYKF